MSLFKRSTIATLLVISLVACGNSKEKQANYLAQVQHTITTATTKSMTDAAVAMQAANKGDEGKKEALTKLDLIIKDMQTTLEAINKLDVPKDGENVQKEVRELFENGIKAFKEDRDTLEKEGLAKMMDSKKIEQRMIDIEKKTESLTKAFTEFIKRAEITDDDLVKARKDIAK